ncbi:MAG: hypothetical protein ABI478_07385 [Propionivibrio sp.]
MADYLDASGRLHFARASEAYAGSRRRRNFLANTTSIAQPVVAPPPLAVELEDRSGDSDANEEREESEDNEDRDLPLLTEVVANEPAPAVPPANRLDEALLAAFAVDLVRTLEQQLASELPALIETSLLDARIELRAGIGATLSRALRDFLAQRQQLRLPLEEPDPDR